jgi:hypothetical protein
MESKLPLIPVGLLTAFIAKLLIYGSNLNEAIVVVSLSAVVMGYEYLSKSRRVQQIETECRFLIEKMVQDNKEFQAAQIKKIEDQTTIISKQNGVINELALQLDSVRNKVTAVNMSSGLSAPRKVGT